MHFLACEGAVHATSHLLIMSDIGFQHCRCISVLETGIKEADKLAKELKQLQKGQYSNPNVETLVNGKKTAISNALRALRFVDAIMKESSRASSSSAASSCGSKKRKA